MLRKITSSEPLVIKSNEDIDNLAEKILVKRGFSPAERSVFLNASMDDMAEPESLYGISDAAERIKYAADNGEGVIVIGDYDVDGITSAYILSDGLKKLGVNILYTHIPDRYKEGYGLNAETLEILAENFYPDLIITVDCGITAVSEVEFLKSIGIDVIVTDHHTPGETLPDCITVNPKICGYPTDLSGAGVAYKLIESLDKKIAADYLEFAALSTISDLMPLTGENRIIVKHGLKKMAGTENIGLKTLITSLKINQPDVFDVGFKIAPRLNAPARVDGNTYAYTLFNVTAEEDAEKICAALDSANAERQNNVKHCYENALQELASYKLYSKRTIIIKGRYDLGILGLVAQKLSVAFYRPVIVLAEDGEYLKGSGRSIEGINIHDMLTSVSDILESYGGHAKAAGLTLKKDNFKELTSRMESYAEKFPSETFIPEYRFDIEASDIPDAKRIYSELEKLAPFGMGNPKPNIMVNGKFRPEYLSADRKHICFPNKTAKLKLWNGAVYKSTLDNSAGAAILMEAEKNMFKDISYEYTVKHIEPEGFVPDETEGMIRYLDAFIENEPSETKSISAGELLKELEHPYGTVMIALKQSTFAKYNDMLNEQGVVYYSGAEDYIFNNYNVLLYSPRKTDYIYHKKTVLLDDAAFNPYLFSSVLEGAEKKHIYGDFSRERFSDVYRALTACARKEYVSAANLYRKEFKGKGFTAPEFYLALKVFEDLEFLKISGDFTVNILKSRPKELKTSAVYRKILRYLV